MQDANSFGAATLENQITKRYDPPLSQTQSAEFLGRPAELKTIEEWNM